MPPKASTTTTISRSPRTWWRTPAATTGSTSDTFVFAKAGHATITDFGAGDTLDLAGLLKGGKAATVTQDHDGVMVTIDSGSSVLLEGLDMAHLLKTDTGFHFV